VGTGAGWSTEVAVEIRNESSGSSKDMCSVSSTRRIGGRRCTGTKDDDARIYGAQKDNVFLRDNTLT